MPTGWHVPSLRNCVTLGPQNSAATLTWGVAHGFYSPGLRQSYLPGALPPEGTLPSPHPPCPKETPASQVHRQRNEAWGGNPCFPTSFLTKRQQNREF